MKAPIPLPYYALYYLVFLSGMAALSWEALWQIKSSLALGVSAWGTALTLAVTMGGMSIGAIITGLFFKKKEPQHPIKVYAVLEWIVGLSGLCLTPAFNFVETLDTSVYSTTPDMASAVHVTGIAMALGLPTFCMGATLPVLGLMARRAKTSIAIFYGLNTLGAATGVLLIAFLLVPLFGLSASIWLVSLVNLSVGLIAWTATIEPNTKTDLATLPDQETAISGSQNTPFSVALILSFVTGFSTFVLEVSWFRSLTAAFMSTSEAFAIMLSCVLLALGSGAYFVPVFKRKKISLGLLLSSGGLLILCATPVIERFDLFIFIRASMPLTVFIQWILATLIVIGPPVFLLGLALPWILDEQNNTRKWGILYGFNAFAAILGSVIAAWYLLPAIGFARTAWFTGALVATTGIFLLPQKQKLLIAGLGVIVLIGAVTLESGVGRKRVQGTYYVKDYAGGLPSKILEVYEGPQSTVSAVEYENGSKFLFIDGFIATQQTAKEDSHLPVHGRSHYMPWMGHLPMLLHPDPKNALVICFGTGQTANAVRKEKPASLDLVDINKNIFKLAHNFDSNEKVLEDPVTHPIVMDGRAYIRRTDKNYDVITLEPMPPAFAGVNALYSKEFYELAKAKMGDDGIIAQWLPFHLLTPYFRASISRTFQDVFPNSILWMDPPSQTGILIGSVNNDIPVGSVFPGYQRDSIKRDMSEEDVKNAIILHANKLREYGSFGDLITDNNQLLAYGEAPRLLRETSNISRGRIDLLERIKGAQIIPRKTAQE